nr:unnamed protein product [Callosobruchus analis]CAI5866024.1 unnamed protein product [Callosobruchus analis]
MWQLRHQMSIMQNNLKEPMLTGKIIIH